MKRTLKRASDETVEVVNRQRRIVLDCDTFQEFTRSALREMGKENFGATIAFVSDRAMRELNREFRARSSTTDVLSFPARPNRFDRQQRSLGDVVISVDRARVQAKENGLDFDIEISQLILHGLLHLCGYDHETDDGEMNQLERKLRRRLKIDL
jgi:probable rRNA maturation factor